MTKEEITELEKKIEDLKKDVELWKKFRELEDEIERLKNRPTKITYPYIPYYPTYPEPQLPWITWRPSSTASVTYTINGTCSGANGNTVPQGE